MEVYVLKEWKQDTYTEKNIWFSKLLVSAYTGSVQRQSKLIAKLRTELC